MAIFVEMFDPQRAEIFEYANGLDKVTASVRFYDKDNSFFSLNTSNVGAARAMTIAFNAAMEAAKEPAE